MRVPLTVRACFWRRVGAALSSPFAVRARRRRRRHMYAVIGRVKLKPGHEQESLAMIEERGVAMVRGFPAPVAASGRAPSTTANSFNALSGSSTTKQALGPPKPSIRRCERCPTRRQRSSAWTCARSLDRRHEAARVHRPHAQGPFRNIGTGRKSSHRSNTPGVRRRGDRFTPFRGRENAAELSHCRCDA